MNPTNHPKIATLLPPCCPRWHGYAPPLVLDPTDTTSARTSRNCLEIFVARGRPPLFQWTSDSPSLRVGHCGKRPWCCGFIILLLGWINLLIFWTRGMDVISPLWSRHMNQITGEFEGATAGKRGAGKQTLGGSTVPQDSIPIPPIHKGADFAWQAVRNGSFFFRITEQGSSKPLWWCAPEAVFLPTIPVQSCWGGGGQPAVSAPLFQPHPILEVRQVRPCPSSLPPLAHHPSGAAEAVAPLLDYPVLFRGTPTRQAGYLEFLRPSDVRRAFQQLGKVRRRTPSNPTP